MKGKLIIKNLNTNTSDEIVIDNNVASYQLQKMANQCEMSEANFHYELYTVHYAGVESWVGEYYTLGLNKIDQHLNISAPQEIPN